MPSTDDEVRTREARKLLAVQQALHSDSDLLEIVEHIELSEVQDVVATDEARVLHDNEVEPSAAVVTASGNTVLASDFLGVHADVLPQLSQV